LFIVPYGLLRSAGWIVDGFIFGERPSENRSKALGQGGKAN